MQQFSNIYATINVVYTCFATFMQFLCNNQCSRHTPATTQQQKDKAKKLKTTAGADGSLPMPAPVAFWDLVSLRCVFASAHHNRFCSPHYCIKMISALPQPFAKDLRHLDRIAGVPIKDHAIATNSVGQHNTARCIERNGEVPDEAVTKQLP